MTTLNLPLISLTKLTDTYTVSNQLSSFFTILYTCLLSFELVFIKITGKIKKGEGLGTQIKSMFWPIKEQGHKYNLSHFSAPQKLLHCTEHFSS